jgi:hypothetical protein
MEILASQSTFRPADYSRTECALAGHLRQVSVVGLHAGLGQHAVDLSAMMGLAIEEVRNEVPLGGP